LRIANDIPASIINLRISIAENLGAKRSDILSDIELTENDISVPTNRVSVEKAILLWESIEKRTGSQDTGLMSGLNVRLQSLGVLGYVLMNSKSVLDTLEKFGIYQRLVASIANQVITKIDDKVKISLDLLDEWQPGYRYTLDFMIMARFSILKSCSDIEILPIELGFQFKEPKNKDSYQFHFGFENIRFGCDTNYLVYKSEDLRSKMIGSDAELYKYFESLLHDALDEHDIIQQYSRSVRKLIHQYMNAEIPLVDDVASELAMSSRSLQSKLKDEGTTYQQLVNEVRKEVSMKQLKNKKLNITEIAFLIGFTDISVFSRNFKKWTGLSPTKYQAHYSRI
jgi:AraC-like DNA-binding protein